MKKITLILVAAAGTFLMASCGQKKTTANDTVTSADSANTAKDTSTTSTLATNTDDADFAVEAGNGGMAEVEMGKLAATKATNPDVKKFGEMMVTDHTKANDELKALAKSKNITLPGAPGADEQKMMDDLNKKTGKDFDKAYVDMMVDDHKKDVSKFQDATKNLKDADLKAFAVKTLPVLQMHLDAINKIHDSMK